MSEQNHYIEMMRTSLQKKSAILDNLLKECEKQSEIVEAEEISWEAFDECVSGKQFLINELSKLDEGFSDLYARVKLILSENKTSYQTEITEMQNMIRRITDQSVRIQTAEERNRRVIEKGFSDTKREIKTSKASMKAASDYYRTMSKLNFVDPQFMDRKK